MSETQTHDILPLGTRVVVLEADPETHDPPLMASMIRGCMGTILHYEATYPEYRCYTVYVPPYGLVILFDDEFQPVD